MSPRWWNIPRHFISYMVCATGMLLEDPTSAGLSLLQLQTRPGHRPSAGAGSALDTAQHAEEGEKLPPQEVLQRLAGQVVLQILLDHSEQPEESAALVDSSSSVEALQSFNHKLQMLVSHILGPGANATEVVDAIGQIVLEKSARLITRSVTMFIESGIEVAGEKAATGAQEVSDMYLPQENLAPGRPEEGQRTLQMRGSMAVDEVKPPARKLQQALKPFRDAIGFTAAAALGSALNETGELLKGLFADGSRLLSAQLIQITGHQLGDALGFAIGQAAGASINDTTAGNELGQLVAVVLGGQVNTATRQAVESEVSSCFNTTIDKLIGKIDAAMGRKKMQGQEEKVAMPKYFNMSEGGRAALPPTHWSTGQLLEAAQVVLQQLVGGLVVDVLSQATGIIKQTTATAASLLALRMGEAMHAPLAEALTPAFTQVLSKNTNNTETAEMVGKVMADTLATRVDDLTFEALTNMVVSEIGQSLDRLVGQVQHAVGGEPIAKVLTALDPQNVQHEHFLRSLQLVTREVQAQSYAS
mmetsp:Transcript_34131/g.62456  ORF Transcript_34131/g.62456 Transcript_34131/m.62456 type:complete len:530 (+) Transcript_34131:43-1632(+)